MRHVPPTAPLAAARSAAAAAGRRRPAPAPAAIAIAAILAVALVLAGSARGWAAARAIILQSTTSTLNSGLYDYLLPLFEAESGIRVHVVAVGTGQALRNARNCDGDVLLVHARAAEEKFVAEGYGTERFDLMYNDFVLIGPAADPAGVRGAPDAPAALARIAAAGALFVSRGDDSGTHRKELSLWRAAGIDPSGASGTWYRETGSGMGATLNAAIGMDAYVLADRASWASFANKRDHAILFEGGDALVNQYGLIAVNPQRCPNVDAEAARRLIEWLISPRGQAAIAAYRVGGQQLFFPNARGR
ncbi:MAG: extracellular solute-binding protein [Roseovarius sp.]